LLRRKIPLGPTIAEAYATLFANLWPFARIAAFPLLLYLLLPVLNIALYPMLLRAAAQVHPVYLLAPMQRGRLDLIIEQGLLLIAVMVFCSHWIQFLIAARKQRDVRPTLFWSRRDPRVVALAPLLMISSLTTLAVVILTHYAMLYGFTDLILPSDMGLTETLEWWQMFYLVFGLVTVVFAVLLEVLIVGRLAPLFAAAAAGEPLRLTAALRLTKGQALRLVTLWALLFWLPVYAMTVLQGHVDSLYLDPRTLETVYRARGWPSFEFLLTWRLLQLPSAVVALAAMALGASFFLRTYVHENEAQEAFIGRFE